MNVSSSLVLAWERFFLTVDAVPGADDLGEFFKNLVTERKGEKERSWPEQ